MLTWELVGAVIGAGLASGREIASFFSRYGAWSFVGIILAVLVMVFLADTHIPQSWRKHWPEALWSALLTLLLIATGGAMLSGAGEIAALTLPLHGAYWIGMTATLLLSWFLAYRTVSGLAWVSRVLLAVLALLIVCGLTIPPMQAVTLYPVSVPTALLRGMTYGGFNAALLVPIMALSVRYSQRQRQRAAMCAGLLILLLLLLGNAVLLRHPALLGEAMPFLRMLMSFGKFGYYLGSACLYLAILSTLTACLRGLGQRPVFSAGIVLVALLGFTGVVETAYPLLGCGCFLLLAAAKFTNSAPASFISPRDML